MGYSFPGRLQDLSIAAQPAWTEYVRQVLGEVKKAPQSEGNSFFIPPPLTPDRGKVVSWDAFPNALDVWYDKRAKADAAAEVRVPLMVGFTRKGADTQPVTVEYRQQDEYCEWHSEYDGDRLLRVTFTSDASDYWEFLGNRYLPVAVDLYRFLLGRQDIEEADLQWQDDVWIPSTSSPSGWAKRFAKGAYNVWNDFNTRYGAVHTTHPDNTLRKAAMLLAGASVRRKDGRGYAITDADRLICRSGFGDPNRTSDPAVGGFVNAQVRLGREVSVADPVGIYITDLPRAGFTGPGGERVDGLWRSIRGDEDDAMILRAVFEVPKRYDYVCLDGTPVTSGAQIARRLRLNSRVRVRPGEGQAPPAQAPVSTCIRRPGGRYRGVMFYATDWPEPPPTVPPKRSATAPRGPGGMPAAGMPGGGMPPSNAPRWDSAILDQIAAGTELEGRWSRWSRWSALLGRWS